MDLKFHSLKEPKKKRNIITEDSLPLPIALSENHVVETKVLQEKYQAVLHDEKLFVEDQYCARDLNRNVKIILLLWPNRFSLI